MFIEAKHAKTPECNFLKSLVRRYFPNKDFDFIFMDGYGNLFNDAIVNQMRSAIDEQENCLLFLDADTPKQNGGFVAKEAWVKKNLAVYNLDVPFFIYPNNAEDGDVECLMEQIARRDLHNRWFDCFEDYEKCVAGIKNINGQSSYNIPNLKGKLHTYISSMNLRAKERRNLGGGNWLFENEQYWDLSSNELNPIVNFLKENLK
mgnify:FL=1